MPIESMAYSPSSDEAETEQKELINRAEELAKKFQEMLGEYGHDGMDEIFYDSFRKGGEIVAELRTFFDRDCQNIPSIKVEGEGTYSKDELKKISDTLWLFKKNVAYYEDDVEKYYIIDKEKVVTNIIYFDTPGRTASEIVEKLKAKGILSGASGDSTIRMVTHIDISTDDIQKACRIIETLDV